MKVISIVIATFNVEEFLKDCLEKIISQKNDKVELILIDGNSKDGTVEIIESYEKYISFWLSEPDNGIYDAWNKAIKVAKGEWIMFLGADDVLLPNAIDTYLKYIENIKGSESIISSKIRMISEDGNGSKVVGEKWDWKKHQKGNYSLAHPGMLHKRTLFEQFGYYDTQFKICADSEFLLRINEHVEGGFVDFVSVNMRRGGKSDSYRAIYESFLIRKKNKSLPYFINIIRLSYRFILFSLLRLKK